MAWETIIMLYMIILDIATVSSINILDMNLLYLQHLLDYNDRPDLTQEDREMLIEDLV